MRRIAFAAVLLLAFDAFAAQRVVLYRCTNASGAVMVQNDVPCKKGEKQEKRVVEAPPPPPLPAPAPAPTVMPVAPVPPPAPVATIKPAPANDLAAANRLPPPALYQCHTFDNDSYLSDNGSPPPRCVVMQTVGIDGNPDNGAGEACEIVNDKCERVADGGLCEAWNKRLLEAESAMRFGKPEQTEASRAEFDRIGKIMRESSCGLPATSAENQNP